MSHHGSGQNRAVDVAEAACPKHMVYGPCGGVGAAGTCEVDASQPCPFVEAPLVAWHGAVPDPRPAAEGRAERPLVVTDLHVRPRDMASLRTVAGTLAGTCDAVLVGDHGGRRNDFPPSFMAAVLMDLGLRAWVTLSCRDRNRVALAAECAALADLGVAGVHCVTGDWQGLAGDSGEAKVFDLDALRLVALAVEAGLTVSVAAAPAAPPTGLRPHRLAEKARAGATVCFVNHCGGTGAVGHFVAAGREAGADLAYLPCVPVISDPASAAGLARLPGLVLDAGVVRHVSDAGHDPAVGVATAAQEAARMLDIPGVAGVNLSGSASSRSELESAEMMAALGRLVAEARAA
jgi:5,10-methylenetetrahydrofolate reductase